MRFHLIDRIVSWTPGQSLTAIKLLALGEEYLADHFPRFPIMPGVLMLQACVEAAGWLWHISTEFRYPVIVLREAKQVKFGAFMTPGRQLQVSVELTQLQDSLATFRARGRNDAGEQTVFAQLTLFGYSLAQHTPTGAEQDALLRDYWQKRWLALTGQWWGPIPSPTHARSAAN
ncbi:MAG: hydroxymyristoyl-ACP dehydratase [Thermogemmata sp.]|jgi:3-hydroxyacyl-[acyl-carrier-protein] dehydratase|uniref:Hydroxymyristoyl-ACP dehydratase n=1 Tax=Thermogemmata fonticola TaxID=2755323 RepID=A0A7V8VCB5_9BACT|nr:hydroxymyristoyl-ACP dehydratase [Thermogemmata fonticola]MBA2225356.1 hydroxymyristoyl-ACP dehydratase [Thermogemmata fonticola]MCX8138685.1 hydroxymyristoyl-ACP dehydratase [Gemmataceae bacterium]GIW84789.1 MAG: beta-hydroxyacyl-ACP dehydratase [Gemmataceae bacterium]